MPSTTLEIVPSPVSYLTRLASLIRTITVLSLCDNPLIWNFTLGKRNGQADVEGPFYIMGAPDVAIEDGKAIMAPVHILKKFHPFLMTVRILSPEGAPVPGAVLDWWQADSSGMYYFSTYTLRGRVTTDEEGYAEVLTVAPGAYGPAAHQRAGHFHLWVHAPSAQPGEPAYDDLTTQLYVCDANNVKSLETDFVNFARKMREVNMNVCWSIPVKDVDEGRPYKNFPELAPTDERAWKRVEWWNSKLGQTSEPGLKLAAGATKEFRLNAKTGWF